jgi:predicted NACHT family NTPase
MGQDRIIYNFFKKHFDDLLREGNLFFIFDSFDEIPAVMDAPEEESVVHLYAKALDDFLHASHKSKGLVSSRPYRAPKVFMGQRLTIRPLSFDRVKKALERYLVEKRQLAREIWGLLLRDREDLLRVIQTPFYLALLARYVENLGKLPNQQYELFEAFVVNRAESDEERLRSLSLTPNTLLEAASRLAYEMTAAPNVGLETRLDQLPTLTTEWGNEKLRSLMEALRFSKLGKISTETIDGHPIFSFVHRRFHEYFVARYLRQKPGMIPFRALLADNRWRETLVLLCEVLPKDQLTEIIDIAKTALMAGVSSTHDTEEYHKAVETMRFLKDGFRSRVDDLPDEVRALVTQFIAKQFEIEILERKLYQRLLSRPVDVEALVNLIAGYLADDSMRESLVKEKPSDIFTLVKVLNPPLRRSFLYNNLLIRKLINPDTKMHFSEIARHFRRGNLLD